MALGIVSRMQAHDTSIPTKLLASLEDGRLIALCLVGSETAWEVLIQRYAPLIYSVARRMGFCESDAEDVFQEVSILLCEHLEAVKESQRLAGWLATTTRRVVLRRAQRRQALAFSELTTPENEEHWLEKASPVAESPEQTVLRLEEQWQLHECLERLPERCRMLLTLLYVQSPATSYQEIEQQLGIPLNSISPTRTRCLQKLKADLDHRQKESQP
jgi:RNA polymerase sigma factor (sigma-70 family)